MPAQARCNTQLGGNHPKFDPDGGFILASLLQDLASFAALLDRPMRSHGVNYRAYSPEPTVPDTGSTAASAPACDVDPSRGGDGWEGGCEPQAATRDRRPVERSVDRWSTAPGSYCVHPAAGHSWPVLLLPALVK